MRLMLTVILLLLAGWCCARLPLQVATIIFPATRFSGELQVVSGLPAVSHKERSDHEFTSPEDCRMNIIIHKNAKRQHIRTQHIQYIEIKLQMKRKQK